METRKKQGRNQAEAEETRKLLKKSKDNFSDFQSYSSSSEEGDEVLEDYSDGFVVQGPYADDYEPERKEKSQKKSKKGQEAPAQKSTLISLLQKQSGTIPKPKQKAKSSKDSTGDDLGLDSILKEFDIDDDDLKKKKKNKNKNAKPNSMPAFLKNKNVDNNENNDDFVPPAPPEPTPQQEQEETTLHETVEDNSKSFVEEKAQPIIKENVNQDQNQEQFINFELQQINESLEFNEEEIKTFQKVNIDVPSDETMDLFMYHVHEENGSLYLFCKYKFKGKYMTVCIMVGQCFYSLQFLPVPGHENDLIDEVRKNARKANFVIHKERYKERKYVFDKLNIPTFAKWYCVQLTPKGDLKQIPQEGDHYSNVFGLSSSLTERFLLKKKIFGPTWIRITEVKKLKQFTTCPMFTIKDIHSLEVLKENQQPDEHVPPFNICTFALQKVMDSKNNPQIVMAAMKILYYWNIETFKPSQSGDKNSQKSIIFACPKKNESLSSEYVKSLKKGSNVVICSNETELLERFINELENYDIDLISSFGLNSVDVPLIYEKLIQHKVKNWYLLGRIHYTKPLKGKFDVLNALAGRVPVDIRVSCMEFLKSKVNDFSAIVKDNLNKERQSIENFDISKKMTNKDDLSLLVNFTLRDSNYVFMLLQKLEVLTLTLQISKLSACPWSRVLLGSSSPRCETLLLQRFHAEKYILPERIKMKNEPLKRESKYKGGMVLDPIRGFYETCILVLDFNSLYPSIIREFNICFTTVNKEKPDAYESKNSKIHGIVPAIMRDLLEARNQIKIERASLQQKANSINHNSNEFANIQLDISRLNIKEKAYKLLANSIYGYLAYKGSRFQSQELAALITKQGRLILQDTVKTMTNMCGSETAVIYGDTDSVMVNSAVTDVDQACKKADELSKAISKKYKFLRLGIDYIFLKMLLVQKKKYAALVYKKGAEPELKKSGLDMVRRDWSIITRKMSEFIINSFMDDKLDKDMAISSILKELEAVSAMLHNGGRPIPQNEEDQNENALVSLQYKDGIPLQHLLISKALKNNIETYDEHNKNPPHVVAALRMKAKGNIKKQGDTISYYIVKSESRDIGSKARYADEVTDFSVIDVDWYLTNQLLHPLSRLCEPFGQIQMSEIANALGCNIHVPIENLPSDNNFACSNIAHISELMFKCRGCNNLIKMTSNYKECLVCPRSECKWENNWKDVANQLTLFVQKFLKNPRQREKEFDITKLYGCDAYLCTYKTNQIPLSTKKPLHVNEYKSSSNDLCNGKLKNLVSSADIFNTLRYFKAIFDKPKKGNDEMSEFRQYMSDTMNYFYQMHEYSRVNFNSIFNPNGTK